MFDKFCEKFSLKSYSLIVWSHWGVHCENHMKLKTNLFVLSDKCSDMNLSTHTRSNMHTTERSSHISISMYICQCRYVLCRRILQLTFKRQRVTQTQCWTLLLSTKRADVNIVIKITLKKLVELANQMVMWTYLHRCINVDVYVYRRTCVCVCTFWSRFTNAKFQTLNLYYTYMYVCTYILSASKQNIKVRITVNSLKLEISLQ